MSGLDDGLRIPAILTVESIPLPDGTWVRRATYGILADCQAEGTDLEEIIEQVEERRIRKIVDRIEHGEPLAFDGVLLRQPAVLLTSAEVAAVAHSAGVMPEDTGAP